MAAKPTASRAPIAMTTARPAGGRPAGRLTAWGRIVCPSSKSDGRSKNPKYIISCVTFFSASGLRPDGVWQQDRRMVRDAIAGEKPAHRLWQLNCWEMPVAAALVAQQQASNLTSTASLVLMPNPRILVVDDHPDTLRLLETFLTLSGFDVVSAVNGADGLARTANGIDAIATDLAMPEMDGFEF